jgi:transmembrane sensor
MSGIIRLRTRAEIDEEAAEWTWRMDSESVTAAEQQAFDAWLKSDTRHRKAYEELARVWRTLDGLAEAKRDEKIATLTHAGKPPTRTAHRPGWWAAAAAAVVAVAVGGMVWLQSGREVQTLATAVGQQRNVTSTVPWSHSTPIPSSRPNSPAASGKFTYARGKPISR